MIITYGFAFYLTILVFLTGIIALLDIVFWRKKRRVSGKKESWIIDYSRALFPVLLIVWVIRSFIVQPYRVPTGSLEPTIMPGDFIGVSQYAYGIKFPIGNFTLIPTGEPKRGDIVLFHYPPNPNLIYIKRLIGLPGDHIAYRNKVLYINGRKAPQQYLGTAYDYGDGPGQTTRVNVYEENLDGVKHKIYVHPYYDETGNFSVTVPKGHYFMMGDNRDNSADSRIWGFVPERNIVGKGLGVWLSFDPVHHRFRWDRIGTSLLPHRVDVKHSEAP